MSSGQHRCRDCQRLLTSRYFPLRFTRDGSRLNALPFLARLRATDIGTLPFLTRTPNMKRCWARLLIVSLRPRRRLGISTPRQIDFSAYAPFCVVKRMQFDVAAVAESAANNAS